MRRRPSGSPSRMAPGGCRLPPRWMIVARERGVLVDASLRFADVAMESERRLQRVLAMRVCAEGAAARDAVLWATAARWSGERVEAVRRPFFGSRCDDERCPWKNQKFSFWRTTLYGWCMAARVGV